jgi:hypothetical protein
VLSPATGFLATVARAS